MNLEILKQKKVILIIVLIIVTVLLIIYSLSKKPQSISNLPQENSNEFNYILPDNQPQVTPSAELMAAINDQMKVDNEYGNWQDDIRNQFPWRKSLPIYSDKYYVYFEMDKQIFIGLLYPQSSDNIEDLKKEIYEIFKNEDIPLDSYTFKWTVKPKS